MAATNHTGKKSTTNKKSASKSGTSRKKQSQSFTSGFQRDIVLLIILAASIILMISTLGFGGLVGDAIGSFSFGAVGLLAYVFPILFFMGFAFLLSNRGNRLAYKKAAAAAVFFIFFCGFVQLLTEGYMRSTTLADYYALCSDYRTGGGIVGGAVCISTTSAFGVAGGYVIIILVLLVCLILITQRSFFGFLNRVGNGFIGLIQGTRERYMEGAPERELKKELRAKERRQKKEQRIRELEEALAEDEDTGRPSFLEGTKLEPLKEKTAVRTAGADRKTPEDDDVTVEYKTVSDGQMEFKIQRLQTPAADDPEEDEDEDIPEIGRIEVEESAAMEDDPEKEPGSLKSARKGAEKKTGSSRDEIENRVENIQHEIKQQEVKQKKKYQFPPMKLLKRGIGKGRGDSDDYLLQTAQKLQDTLHNFGVDVTVTNVSCGPTVTRYELQPEVGVKVSRIVSLADDIKLNLATPDIRIEAPIPGKAAVGIEVPNKENSPVMLRDLIQSEEFQNSKSKLSFAAGKDIGGKTIVADIAKMPHLLIAGATGSGKSVCINTLIVSILYKASPDEVRMIMIDPKVVELSVYNGIPHLLIPVVTDPKKAAGALNWAVSEMTTRYNTFAEFGVRNLAEYNKKVENMTVQEGEERPEKLPQILIIVDELADLMMVAPSEVEEAICRLAQLARAAGLHLVIATQRPSVNVITGVIKANMPSRIAFAVSSGVDSRTILDSNGAEKLLGRGDMLFHPQGYSHAARLQGAFISDEEVSSIVRFLSDKNPSASYSNQVEEQVNKASLSAAGGEFSSSGDGRDAYFAEAGKFIIEKEKASIGMLQRMFKIGFNRAARIMDQLSEVGVVGPEEGTKPRKVLMTMEEFEAYLEEG